MHQNESNKISLEYILSWIYTSKIKFKFLSHKIEKFKVNKQKETQGIQQSCTCFVFKNLYQRENEWFFFLNEYWW